MNSVSVGDRELPLYVAEPDSDSHPGILLVHAWWGLNECFRDIADRLSSEGYLVVAPDLYHGEVASTIDEADTLSSELDVTEAVEDVTAAFDYLHQHEDHAHWLGVMAASMGVYYALKLVQDQPNDVDAAIVLYGTSDGEYGGTSTAILGHFGENDDFNSEPEVNELRERLQDGEGPVTFYTYPDAEHWFFEPDQPEYDEVAAELAWTRTIEFLRNQLRSPAEHAQSM